LGLLISTKRGGGTPWALLVSANRTGPAGGDGKADAGGDPLHAMQFRAAQLVQVSGMCPSSRPSRSDLDCPPDTGHDRCLWHVDGTASENDDTRAWRGRLQRAQRVRPVPGDHCLVGKGPEGSRQPYRSARKPLSGRHGSWLLAVGCWRRCHRGSVPWSCCASTRTVIGIRREALTGGLAAEPGSFGGVCSSARR
jgi:hypothetical protein